MNALLLFACVCWVGQFLSRLVQLKVYRPWLAPLEHTFTVFAILGSATWIFLEELSK